MFPSHWLMALVLAMTLSVNAAEPVTAGLKVWLRADALQGYAENDPVSLWSDDSGNNHHAVAPAGNEPRYRAAGFNGKPCLQFSDAGNQVGLGQFMDLPYTYNANGLPFTCFVVFKSASAFAPDPSRDTLVQQLNDPVLPEVFLGRTILFVERNVRHDFRVYSFANANLLESRQPYAPHRPTIQAVIQTVTPNAAGPVPHAGNTIVLQMFRNGAVDGLREARTNTLASAGPWRIGDNKPRNGGLEGQIAEVLVYDRALTPTERNQVEHYLGGKYGIEITDLTITVNGGFDPANPDVPDDGFINLEEAIRIANLERAPSATEASLVHGDLFAQGKKEIHFQVGTWYDPLFESLNAQGQAEEIALGDWGNFFIFQVIFDVPTAGYTPIRANNVTLNGYTQFRTRLNHAPIGQPNVARLRISIDGRERSRPHILKVEGSNVWIQGLSFMNDLNLPAKPSILFGSGATDGGVSGCRVGMFLTAGEIYAGHTGIALEYTAGGQVIGTDGDGVGDASEMNVIVGHREQIRILQSERVRVAGNMFGLLPSGLAPDPAAYAPTHLSAMPQTLVGGGFHGLVFGTDANGVADAGEANWVGPMETVFVSQPVGFGPSERVAVRGNVFGLNLFGAPAPIQHFLVDGTGDDWTIGTDGDGVRDEIEANRIASVAQQVIRFQSPGRVALRGNRMSGNAGLLWANTGASFHSQLLGQWSGPSLDFSTRVCELVGTTPASKEDYPTLQRVLIDLYLADTNTLATNPQGAVFLGAFEEGGPLDLDARPGHFRFPILVPVQDKIEQAMDPSGMVHFIMTHNIGDSSPGLETGPFSSVLTIPFERCTPPAAPPRITQIAREAGGVRLHWTAAPGLQYTVERASSVSGPYLPLAGALPGPEYLDPAPESVRFYRIRVE